MFFNNDPVTVPMIERNSSDPPEMDTSDLNSLVEEAVLSFHHISYQETVQSSFACCKHTCVIERLSNIRYVHEVESTTLNNFSANTNFLYHL